MEPEKHRAESDWWLSIGADDQGVLSRVFGPSWVSNSETREVARLYLESHRRIREIEATALEKLKGRDSPDGS